MFSREYHPHVLAKRGCRYDSPTEFVEPEPDSAGKWWVDVVLNERPLAVWERPFFHAADFYANGQCLAFAAALSTRFGLPLRAYCWRVRIGADEGIGNLAFGGFGTAKAALAAGYAKGRFLNHAAVVLPSGNVLDAHGTWVGAPRRIRNMREESVRYLGAKDYRPRTVADPRYARAFPSCSNPALTPGTVLEVAASLVPGALGLPVLPLAERALRLRFINPRRLSARHWAREAVAEFLDADARRLPEEDVAELWRRLTTTYDHGDEDLPHVWAALPESLRGRFLRDAKTYEDFVHAGVAVDAVQDAFVASGYDLGALADALEGDAGHVARIHDPWIDEVWLPLLAGILAPGRVAKAVPETVSPAATVEPPLPEGWHIAEAATGEPASLIVERARRPVVHTGSGATAWVETPLAEEPSPIIHPSPDCLADPARAAAVKDLATALAGKLVDPTRFGLTPDGIDVAVHPVAYEGAGGRVHLLPDPDGRMAWACPAAPGAACKRIGVLTKGGAFRPTLPMGEGIHDHVGLALAWLRGAGIPAIGRRVTLPRAPAAIQAPPGSADWVDADEARSRRLLRDGRVISRMPNGEIHLFTGEGRHLGSADPSNGFAYGERGYRSSGSAPGRNSPWKAEDGPGYGLHNLPTDEMIDLLNDVDPEGRLFQLVAMERRDSVGFRIMVRSHGQDAVGTVDDPLDFPLLPLHARGRWLPAETAGDPCPAWEEGALACRPEGGIEFWANWYKRPDDVPVVEAVLWSGEGEHLVVAVVRPERIDLHSRKPFVPRLIELIGRAEASWPGRPLHVHGPVEPALLRDESGRWGRRSAVAEVDGFTLYRGAPRDPACVCLDPAGDVAWSGYVFEPGRFGRGNGKATGPNEIHVDRTDEGTLDLGMASRLAERAGLALHSREGSRAD